MAVLKRREHDQPAETEVEAEIREFVRRDVVTNRERQPENESEMMASSINSVLQRATTTSVQEIEKLITELQTLSDTLHSERARVQQETVQYSTLTRAALESTNHRRKPDAVQKSPRLAGPTQFEIPVARGIHRLRRGKLQSRFLCHQTTLKLGCWSLWNAWRHECTGQLPHSWKSALDSKSTATFRPSSDQDACH
jgi:ElaB/YqjD/DUF883 family membrane-anchored ribosome-binding protein